MAVERYFKRFSKKLLVIILIALFKTQKVLSNFDNDMYIATSLLQETSLIGEE